MTTTATTDGPVPIQGYDKLELRGLFAQLRGRSQSELTQIDVYERSHQGRRAVLDKLRYLRENEPIQGYDGLDSEQVLAALADADVSTLAAVRRYETKLRARVPVLGGVAELRAERERARTPVAPGAAPGAVAAEPVERWPGDKDGAIMGTVITVGILAMIALAAVLMVVLLAILAFVVITAFAPDLLIG
jgi:hypothetical protein